ncbi:MAG: hypothetical protein Greene101420_865 [Parcubacteria group bacterium Greene1014_20]|nr:MAG: hypothetical protein Greene101420_865 [Parcubacteria group bacterium Greene1014_20]
MAGLCFGLSIGIGYYFGEIAVSRAAVSPVLIKVSKTKTLGGELFEKSKNPFGGEMPQMNPFLAEHHLNPLKGIYKNPFTKK